MLGGHQLCLCEGEVQCSNFRGISAVGVVLM